MCIRDSPGTCVYAFILGKALCGTRGARYAFVQYICLDRDLGGTVVHEEMGRLCYCVLPVYGKKSWGLYLFHYLPLALCAFFIYDSPIPAGVKYIAVAAAAFGGAFLLYEIISRIPVLRWCVCGIGKKQHSVRCRQADV